MLTSVGPAGSPSETPCAKTGPRRGGRAPGGRRTMPPGRRRRLQVAVASLNLSLARRRGHLAGVVEQVKFLDSPVTGPSDEDIALGSDLRAVAFVNLGTAEAWALGPP